MPDKLNSFTCGACGWVHFGLTKSYCIKSADSFNKYFDSLSDENKLMYYGGFKKERDEKGNLIRENDVSKVKKASLETYKKCFNCGGSYKNFHKSTKEELEKIFGSTIQPIMIFNEKENE